MDIMHILKVTFVVMLCVPVAYIAYILVDQLLDLANRSTGASGKKKAGKRKKRSGSRTKGR